MITRVVLAALLVFAQDAEVQKVIQRLGSSDFEEQGKAAKILEGLGADALPDLETATRSTNAQIRDWAIKIKGRIEQRLGRKAAPEPPKAPAAAPPTRTLEKAEGWVSKYPARATRDKSGPQSAEPQILEALRWLTRHQAPEGHWRAESYGNQCPGEKCGGPGERDFDTGVTGLALLAFLGADHGLESAEFGGAVKRGLLWLMDRMDPEGCVGERGMKYMYNHLIGALALTEAYLMSGSPKLKAAAEKATQFTLMAQNPWKAWRYSARCGDDDTSVTGWAVLGLQAAELAGIEIPKKSLDWAMSWLNEVNEPRLSLAGYNARGTGKVYIPGKNEQFDHHPTMTAISVFSRVLIQKKRGDPALGGIEHVVGDLPELRPKLLEFAHWSNKVDFYFWYWGSLAVYQLDGSPGPTWRKWFATMKTALVENQGKTGCRQGSWDPGSERWGGEGGRVTTTALGVLILETPHRYPVVTSGSIPRKK